MINPFECIISNNLEQLNTYLENGNVNIVDSRGKSLIDYAIKLHNNEIFHTLLKAYINLDICDDLGNTCYHYAVINNRLGYLKILLKSSGNPLRANDFGQTPLYLACLYGREQMVQLYQEKYILDLGYKDSNDENCFIAMVKSGNCEMIKNTKGYEKYLESTNYLGDTALSIASGKSNLEMVVFLLSQGAFVNSKNKLGETPLFNAVRSYQLRNIDLLIKNGAIVDCKNNNGETIFDIKMSEKNRNIINELINKYDLKSYKKSFPLHYAIIINDVAKIKANLNLSNINKRDSQGYTPKQLALKYNDKRIIKLINDYSKEASFIINKQL